MKRVGYILLASMSSLTLILFIICIILNITEVINPEDVIKNIFFKPLVCILVISQLLIFKINEYVLKHRDPEFNPILIKVLGPFQSIYYSYRIIKLDLINKPNIIQDGEEKKSWHWTENFYSNYKNDNTDNK